jgi:hypothetical protein
MTHYDSGFDARNSRTETRSRFDRDGRRLGARFRGYVRRLTAEQWMLFLAGVIVGLILG